jgi:hypothetical protein
MVNKESIPEGRATLNEFAAACLESAEQELRAAGTVKEALNFGYGMKSKTNERSISRYELTGQGSDEWEREIEKVTDYVRATSADGVSIAADLADDPETLALFAGYDGVLLVAAASPDASVTILRPYKRSGAQLAFGDPKITDAHPMPLLQRILGNSKGID